MMQFRFPYKISSASKRWCDLDFCTRYLQQFQFSRNPYANESNYLTESGEKNPAVLSFEAMNKVLPGGTHFAILQLINSGRVSRSR